MSASPSCPPEECQPAEPYPLPAAARRVIAGAERYLAGLPTVAATRDIAGRLVAAELDEHLRGAELPGYPRESAAALRRFAERIAAEDVRALLPPGAVERFTARAMRATQRLADRLKADALARALPLLGELERLVVGDPFARLDRTGLETAVGELRGLRQQVVSALAPVPAGDPDLAPVQHRLEAADQRLAAARAAWGKATLVRRVTAGWAAIAGEIAGWEDEAGTPPAGLLAAPEMPRTRLAVQRLRTPAGPDAHAVFAAAGAQLAAAYELALDEAERMPTPRGPDLDRPTRFAADAECALAGTPRLAPILARARALDARWQAEVGAARRASTAAVPPAPAGAAETWAAETWAEVVAAAGARTDIEPTDPRSTGRTVLLAGVHNRAGWDFADCDLALRAGDTVLAGYYDPHVLRALDRAWHEQDLDVCDREPWDVVAVVEGPGTVREHTMVTLLDRDTGAHLGMLGEWRPADCVRLRVIALHAGPLLTAPGRD